MVHSGCTVAAHGRFSGREGDAVWGLVYHLGAAESDSISVARLLWAIGC
jgi:hypothetical protein